MRRPAPNSNPLPDPPVKMMQPLDVLAIGAHPDDVEWGCGGLLAGLAAAGRRVGIVVLTRGEAGTRGTADQRIAEAQAGARALGAAELQFLDCGDAGLRTSRDEEDHLIHQLRRLRPHTVLAPPRHDRHPDHERAAELVRAACFYAGLRKRPGRDDDGRLVDDEILPAHRPSNLLHYMLHEPFDPDVIVDCTASWSTKLAALRCHASQFPVANGEPAEAGGADPEQRATWISKRSFWDAIEGRARHYGQRIGAEFAEPFLAGGPTGIDASQFEVLYLDRAPAADLDTAPQGEGPVELETRAS